MARYEAIRAASQDWRDRTAHRLRQLGVVLLLALVAVGLTLWWVARWTPDAVQYPQQGALVFAPSRDVPWPRISAAGADFAYVVATRGAQIVTPDLNPTLASAQKHGMPVGIIHRYTLCASASDQAANVIRNVPRSAHILPAAVWLKADGDDCGVHPSRDLVISEVTTFIGQIERHLGRRVMLAPDAGFEAEYAITSGIDRAVWARRNFFVPDYGTKPWTLWLANRHARISGVPGVIGWIAVADPDRAILPKE